MSAITRDEVAHLARLARLALPEDELDQLAAQLDVIISAVAKVQEVAKGDIPPTSHALPLTNVYRPDDVKPGLTPTRRWRRLQWRTAGPGSRRSWGRRMTELPAERC